MFSVVIPLYNKELSIRNTIQSVLDQTFADFEIVIVNDGSTDSSAAIVEEFTDPRIRLIHQKNQGVSAARNRGIKEARKEWIAFLDADDEWYPNKLIEFSIEFKKFPSTNWGFSAFERIIDGQLKRKVIFTAKNMQIENIFDDLLKGLIIHTSSVIVRKRFLLDENIHFRLGINRSEDREVWYRLAIHDQQPIYVGKIVSKYIDHPDQESLTKNSTLNKKFHFLSIIERLDNDIKKLNDENMKKAISFLQFQIKVQIYNNWTASKFLPFEFEHYLYEKEYHFLSNTVRYPKIIKRIIRKIIIDGFYRNTLRNK